jgi:hypothetical protein
MKKLTIAAVALFLVLGMSQFIARSATNKGEMSSSASTAVKSTKLVVAGKVSPMTLKRFNRDFGTPSNVVWEKSKSLDKVSFVKGGDKMVAYYNTNSKLVGTGSARNSAGVPDQALADINARYKDYSIGSVIFYDKNEANLISKLIYGTILKEENYLMELTNDQKTIVVKVNVKGEKAIINQI